MTHNVGCGVARFPVSYVTVRPTCNPAGQLGSAVLLDALGADQCTAPRFAQHAPKLDRSAAQERLNGAVQWKANQASRNARFLGVRLCGELGA